MADLDVQQDALDAARVRLEAAASPVLTSCLGFDATGSPSVSDALSNAESLLTLLFGALGDNATKSATDTASVASSFTASDEHLAQEATR